MAAVHYVQGNYDEASGYDQAKIRMKGLDHALTLQPSRNGERPLQARQL